MWGARRGFDAVVICCAADPGLQKAQQAIRIPVVGAGQAGKQVGALLGRRFSLVAPLSSSISLYENQSEIYGLEGKLVSVRPINIPVLELNHSQDVSTRAFAQALVWVVKEDGGCVIMLICTGTIG